MQPFSTKFSAFRKAHPPSSNRDQT